MWHKYLPLATFAHNTFNSPNIANHSPYKLVFGRKPKLLLDLEMDKQSFLKSFLAGVLLCNPKFICKNNRYFNLSSTYFLYPLASLPKMVIQDMPASI